MYVVPFLSVCLSVCGFVNIQTFGHEQMNNLFMHTKNAMVKEINGKRSVFNKIK